MSALVNYNGQIYPVSQLPLTFENRAFKYGDAIFETIKCNGHYPLHFSLHYKRLSKALLSLKMDISSLPREEHLQQDIVKLLQKKKHYGASRVRIQVFRDGQGLYTPETNRVNYLIESSELASVPYVLNKKGLLTDVYNEMQKSYSPVSFFKNANSLHYVLAAIYKKENKLDDCFLINQDNKMIEASSSNLFWVKEGVIYTPSVFTGCVDGIMRTVVIDVLKRSGLAMLVETQGITGDELIGADEVFITNAIQGIQWVVGFKEKRYFSQLTREIVKLVNDFTFEQ